MRNVFIIAEAGVNHNGSLELAKKLIDVAADAGADAVKFQTFQADRLVSLNAPKAAYQLNNTSETETQYDMLKKLELTKEMHIELIAYCKMKNIMFLSTPFDIDSVYELTKLGISIIKIPSGEITNLPYLREVAKQKKKVILSTGMSELQEVKEAVEVLKENGADDIMVMHCNTQYPTPMEDVNLMAMVSMKEKLGLPTGYSDHTQGIEVPIAAAALGAAVIEKHFTLDKEMEGPDHKASLNPQELKQMVLSIRNIERALGSDRKLVTESEKENRDIVRKSIVAACKIEQGEYFTEQNITTKRPGTGISPMKWDEIIGKTVTRSYEADEMIRL